MAAAPFRSVRMTHYLRLPGPESDLTHQPIETLTPASRHRNAANKQAS